MIINTKLWPWNFKVLQFEMTQMPKMGHYLNWSHWQMLCLVRFWSDGALFCRAQNLVHQTSSIKLYLLSHFILDQSRGAKQPASSLVGFTPQTMQISMNSHLWKRVNRQARRFMFMQECRLAILVYRGLKSVPKWVTTILLITHENGESGCCEAWLFCGPCYFNRDLQWNVFIRAEAAA